MDHVVPLFVQVQPQSSTITVRGNGETRFPFALRHDIGRTLAATFKNPAEYKDRWLTVANGWFTLGEIARIMGEQSGINFQIQNLELDDKVPVLRLLEVNGLNIFDPNVKTSDLPVQLADMKPFFKWDSTK